VHAFDWFNELLGYESSRTPISYARAREVIPGKTIYAKMDKFMFRLRGDIVTWTTKHEWTQFRSSWTGMCGIKGHTKPNMPGAKKRNIKTLTRNLNIAVEEKYCKYIDQAQEIKNTIGNCPTGHYVEQQRELNGAIEYTAIKMTSDCSCLRQYYFEASIPSQEGRRIKVTTSTFQPYKMNTLTFVDYNKCERFFEDNIGKYDELMDIVSGFSQLRSSFYNRQNTSRSRAGDTRYFNILTGTQTDGFQ
tara:strand:+ start:172409 stop:173149 length:741 start_codon:yes stop_codon:yes gene_type:complete